MLDVTPTQLGLAPAAPVPPHTLAGFRGAPDTLNLMRTQAWGPHGEQSVFVRQLTEEIVADLFPKDYLGEILAIRNFYASHLRYTNDPLHVEYVKTPERMVTEIRESGKSLADCDEIAEAIATSCLQVGRIAEYVVVGFGEPGDYSHVFTRVDEPKSGTWVVTDPVAGSDEREMLDKVTTSEIWSLDEHEGPTAVGFWSRGMGNHEPPRRLWNPRPYPWRTP